MGRGKTSAAIRYMKQHMNECRFMYVTPYLTEVDRICEACGFSQPESEEVTKLTELKNMFRMGKNISTTHALFCTLDKEALEILSGKKYSLIIDEGIDLLHRITITPRDIKILKELSNIDDNGLITWKFPDYSGRFTIYKELADSGSLYLLDTALIYLMNPDILKSFRDITMMTYLFDGQYQKAYMDFYGFEYEVVGIETDNDSYFFSNKPDVPPPQDYRNIIHIVDEDRLNNVGDEKYSLSKNWYNKRDYDNKELRALRNNMNTFFRRRCGASKGDILWTCFKSDVDKLVPKSGKRYISGWVQSTARATNAYKDRDCVAYLINRFLDPNITKFINNNDAGMDVDKFALSEMLQFIWRSAIRDGKPINVYIPSKRMRELLQNWIEETYKGVCNNDT